MSLELTCGEFGIQTKKFKIAIANSGRRLQDFKQGSDKIDFAITVMTVSSADNGSRGSKTDQLGSYCANPGGSSRARMMVISWIWGVRKKRASKITSGTWEDGSAIHQNKSIRNGANSRGKCPDQFGTC